MNGLRSLRDDNVFPAAKIDILEDMSSKKGNTTVGL